MRAIVLLLIVAGAVLVSADLPVHCVKSDIVGKWKLSLGQTSSNARVSCGVSDAQNAQSITVELSLPDKAVDADGNQGSWTMIYDEGLEVHISGKKYFAFFKYQTVDVAGEFRHRSYCHATMPGSYHTDDVQSWGCLAGSKVGATNSLSYVSADAKQWRACGRDTDCSAAESHEQGIANEVEMRTQSMLQELLHSASKMDQPEVTDDQPYEDEEDMVNEINGMNGKWTATSYDHFKGSTMGQMRARGGSQSFASVRDSLKAAKLRHITDVDDGHYVADLPKAWDWRDRDGVNYMFEAVDQGNCGSCYAFATMDMIQTRLAIKSKNTIRRRLSVQDILSCNSYAQGCAGGFPFLAAKYTNDFGVASTSCMSYQGVTGQCPANRQCRASRVKVNNYQYVGGFYGGCTERAMMKEIMNNGPVALGFEAPNQLFHYRSGVFEFQGHVSARNFFEPTNHAVLALGWGETEDGTKYWIAKNSWGRQWGEGGYFRIRRGADTANFESMAVAADPVVPREEELNDSEEDTAPPMDDANDDGNDFLDDDEDGPMGDLEDE